MDWGSLVSTVVGTVGEVVGSLLGVNSIEEGVIFYSHAGVEGASQNFGSTFYCDDGKYYLFNQSPKKSDIVSISFPTVGNQGAQTISVQGADQFNITDLFQQQAMQEQCQFQLAACSMQKQMMENGQESQSLARISVSGYEIPQKQKRSLGAYMDVAVQQDQVIITPKSNQMQLQSLQMLNVQGSGDTKISIMDVQAKDGQVIVKLPKPLLDNEMVSVDVVASVAQQAVAQVLLEQANDARFGRADEALAARLKKAPKLNWGEQ